MAQIAADSGAPPIIQSIGKQTNQSLGNNHNQSPGGSLLDVAGAVPSAPAYIPTTIVER